MPTLGEQLRNPKIDEMLAQRAMQTGMGTPQGVTESQPRTLAPMQPQSAPRPLIKPVQPSPAETAHQGEFNRLTTGDTGKSGISQIKNPVGRTLLQVADAIGSGLFPRIAMGIPGTQAHHEQLVGQEAGALDQEQENRANTQQQELQAAQIGQADANTMNLESKPELMQAQMDLKREQDARKGESEAAKLAETSAHHQGQLDIQNRTLTGRMREHGLRPNESGDLEPVPYEEMTPQEQVNYDLKSAQRELADATAQMRRAQASGDLPTLELAKKRLELSERRLNLFAHNASRMDRQFEFRSQGTVGGVAPAGTMIAEDGRPVGTANAPNVRPTGTQRARAGLAESGLEQRADMEAIVNRRPELFGPTGGAVTAFNNWIGSEDADAKAFLSARQILADHAAGVFGGRSEYATRAQEIAAGRLNDNPPAMLAGMRQIKKAMEVIQRQGTVRTVGSDAVRNGGGVTEYVRDASGKLVPKK